MCEDFCRLRVFVLRVLSKGSTFSFASHFSSLGRTHAGSLYGDEEQKRLVYDVTYTRATHTGHVRDITDSDCQTKYGSAQGSVFATLKRHFLTS